MTTGTSGTKSKVSTVAAERRVKGYVTNEAYVAYRERYRECIRMLNGLEKALDRHLPEKERRWAVAEQQAEYVTSQESMPSGWPT